MKNYTAVLKKSGNQFVALCLELGVVGCGATRPKAMKSLRDAIDSYLDYAKDAGLPDSRPVAISQLHEFIFLDKQAKPIRARNGKMQLTALSYA
jgi:predicted RNase H-like HicB family nuclease